MFIVPFNDQSGHIACPHCGKHTVVMRTQDHYVCLSCHWQRNLAQESNFPPGWLIIIPFLLVLL